MKIFLLASLMCLITSCDKSFDFVKEETPVKPASVPAPVPEPAPVVIDKNYNLDVAYTVSGDADVDILWLIDNSPSMGTAQQLVSDNTRIFMNEFTKAGPLRWRMGMISTTEADQPYVGFTPADALNFQTPDAVTKFQQAVGRLGENGDTTEKTYTPVLNALHQFPDFLRPNAYLALIIVTDEEEQSDVTTNDFLNQIKALKANSLGHFLTYGIFSDRSAGCPGSAYNGGKYPDLISQTHGKTYPLCSSNFGLLLSQLGADLVSKIGTVSNKVVLSDRPIVSTIEVYYAGQKLRSGPTGQWIYNPIDNVIVVTDSSILTSNNHQVRIVFQPQIHE